MPKDNLILTNRDKEVNALYLELSQQGYSSQKILQMLSEKFYLKPRTIYGIVSGEYERRKNPLNNDK